MIMIKQLGSSKELVRFRRHPVLVRDLRHDPAAGEVAPHRRRRSSRLHWCRGRAGVTHDLVWVPYKKTATTPEGWEELAREARDTTHVVCVCRTCGKRVDGCYSVGRKHAWRHVSFAPPCPRCAAER